MKAVFRAGLLIAILAIGAYLLGFWSPDDVMRGSWRRTTPTAGPAGTGSVGDRLDQLDERTGRAVQRVDAYVSEAGLSGKIKSKMALDELVRARTIEVATTGGVVTLSGTVGSLAERDQALRLARDTSGVTQVVDHLIVVPQHENQEAQEKPQ